MQQSAYAIQFMMGSTNNTLELSGNLVINHIESIYNDLKENIDYSKKLIMNVTQIKGIDLTCIQLLMSLKKEFAVKGVPFELNLQLNEEQERVINSAGFISNFFK